MILLKTKRLTELALLTACALIMFIVELRLPDLSPIPGVKLGLANIFTVYAVYRFKPEETFLMVISRVLLGALFSANFSAVIYSLSGAVVCLVGMLFIRKVIPQKYMWLCSMAGAVFHNFGQIAVAVIMLRSFAVFAYLPVLIISGCIAGLFTGLCAGYVVSRIKS